VARPDGAPVEVFRRIETGEGAEVVHEMGLVEVAAPCREIRHADATPFADSVQRIPGNAL
jgi:hypothetical protein